MTDTIKVLAQVSPITTTLTSAYTVATSALLSSICICNTNSTVSYFRISIAITGSSDDISQYLYYDLPIDANDTFIATIGLTLAATDVLRVYAADSNVVFSLFGIEVSS